MVISIRELEPCPSLQAMDSVKQLRGYLQLDLVLASTQISGLAGGETISMLGVA